MSDHLEDWGDKGFGRAPILRSSPGGGLLLYRCWGKRSPGPYAREYDPEWGSGYFALSKPASVLEAEMRYNIVDWNNGVHFVSTFRLKPGFTYWFGPIGHGASDVHIADEQAYIEQPLKVKLDLVRSREVLPHNVFVSPHDGHAGLR